MISIEINTFGRGIEPLTNAEAEAAEVAAIWRAQGASVKTLIGAQATRAAFVGLDLAGCRPAPRHARRERLLGRIGAGPVRLAYLLGRCGHPSAEPRRIAAARGFGRAERLPSGQRALSLPGGGDLPGDDLFGLQATLFQAGVRSVIAALWAVNDDSAPKIVPELHRRLARGDQPEQALQGALCAYLDTPGNNKAIYYWAPFFMSSIGRMS